MSESSRPVSAPLDTQALPPPDVYDGDGPMLAGNTAYSRAKVEQIIAPYAARIAHLERELELAHCAFIGSENARKNAERAAEAERKPVPKLYTCIGKGGEYELIGEAIPAGVLSSTLMVSGYTIYRNVSSGKMFVRTASDFYQRMTKIAASLSPQSKQEEAE